MVYLCLIPVLGMKVVDTDLLLEQRLLSLLGLYVHRIHFIKVMPVKKLASLANIH